MSEDGKAPKFWGIDPDVIYKWTPLEAREIVTPAKYEGEGDSRKLIAEAEYGKPLPGAPAVWLAAPLEKDYMAIENARDEFRRARARLEAEGKTVDDAVKVFPDELVSSILRSLVKKIEIPGPRGALTLCGDWAKDEVKIRRWRLEMFLDVVRWSAYETEEVEGFTSPLESQPG